MIRDLSVSNAAHRILLMTTLLLSFGYVAAEVIDGEDLVDPTRPFAFTALGVDTDTGFLDRFVTAVPTSFEVTIVRASSSSPLAVVNNQRVTIGDSIGGALVIAIDRSGVTLLVNDEEIRVNLYNTNIKAPVVTR